MKKLISTLAALLILSFTFTSCNVYHSVNSASKMSHLSANPFVQKIAKSVLANVSSQVIGKGLTSFKGKPKLLSPIKSLFNTAESVSAFKGMLSKKYGLTQGAVANNFSKWNNMRDVIGFVARNAKKVDFSSYTWPK